MKYTICFLLGIFGLLVSCGTDETVVDPFKGKDHYIYSFALTIGDQVYDAEIVDTLIRVTLPPNISLKDASVRYELAEKATISPAPETIEDWSRPVNFVVVSHSGERQTYTYDYAYEDIVYKGNVFLKTQAEVDVFAVTGISAIEGTLIIGFYENNPVTNLDSLIHLHRVDGAIVFKYPGYLESIRGLENLKEVGSLTIPDNEFVTSVSFPDLERVTSDLLILSQNVTDVSLPSLRTVVHDFSIRNIKKNINACHVGNLESCGGKLSVWGSGAEFTFPKLTSANSLDVRGNVNCPELSSVSDIMISGGVALFPLLKECKNIQTYNDGKGDFPVLATIVEAAAVSSTTSTPCLTTVGGDFSGFSPLLESVGGVLSCGSATLIDMPHLQKVGGLDIGLSASVDLTNLQIGQKLVVHQSKGVVCTLKGPEECDYLLNVQFADQPENITFEGFRKVGALEVYVWEGSLLLPFVYEVEGDCSCMVGNSGADDRIELANLKKVGGTIGLFAHQISCPSLVTIGKKLKFSDNNTAFEVLSLPVLESVGNGSLALTNPCLDIDLRWCKSLKLPVLKQIQGSVNIAAGVAERIAMPALTTLDGTLQITGNNSVLTTLDFPLLAAIRKVEIKNCTALKDYSTFAGVIPELNSSTWRISGCGYNPTWQDMSDGKYIGQ